MRWLVFVVLLSGCAAAEKLLTSENANGVRTAIRQACADIAEADRLLGVDAGITDGAP